MLEFETIMLIFATINMGSRGINQLKIYPKTRMMIKMVVDCLFDIIPFMIVLIATIYMIALCVEVIKKHELHNFNTG